jgi:hypothetical protein
LRQLVFLTTFLCASLCVAFDSSANQWTLATVKAEFTKFVA